MLAPDQMTDDTLSANLRLYDVIAKSQPDDYGPEDVTRYNELLREKERRVAARDTLADGLYVSKAWAHDPHQSIMWRRSSDRWERVTSASEFSEDDRPTLADPKAFYGLGWEKHIVRLVAEGSVDRG